jgi:aquaporin Z
VLPYLLAQCAGAVLASLALAVWFGSATGLGITQPRFGVPAAVGFELVMSGFLMLVILGVAQGARERGLLAAVTIGGVVGLEAAFGGPVSGASMNPARSLAPALVSGELSHLWLYLCMPVLGMLVAVPLCAALRGPACCLGIEEGPR